MFQDVPVVVSAARQAQPINWLSVPVSIITAEDIHYSGLTSIPDILQFTPGVDVLQIDRNNFVVGVRGMHELYSDRLLTLIDGRNADNVLTGGANILQLPVLMEDIARIEVVRGPAGAVWGANAFTGLLNIITKEPEDCLGLLASATVNHFGDSYSHVRYAAKTGKWSYLASVAYEDAESSDEAISDDGFASHDFRRSYRFRVKSNYRPSDRTKFSLGAAHTHQTEGAPIRSATGEENGPVDIVRAYARADHKFSDRMSGYLQWYGALGHTKEASTFRYITGENTIEGQLDLLLGRKHRMSVGGNFRWMYIDIRNSNTPGKVNFLDAPFSEHMGGLFLMDRWEVTDRLVLEGQIRGDWYSETHTDWSSRLTGLYALDESKRHVVRLSGAKAFRTPLAVLRESKQQYGFIPAGTFGPFQPAFYMAEIRGPADRLENEESWSVEVGYTGELAKMLTFCANAYYQRFDRLIGFSPIPDSLGFGRTLVRPDNIAGADSFGTELELALRGKMWKTSAWYAFNDFRPDKSDQDIRAYLPATHKAGLTARLFLPDDWTVNANYRYKTQTSDDHVNLTYPTTGAPSHRVDVTVSKKLLKGDAEVLVGVSDLFNRASDEVAGLGRGHAHDTPGRTFFVRLQLRF